MDLCSVSHSLTLSQSEGALSERECPPALQRRSGGAERAQSAQALHSRYAAVDFLRDTVLRCKGRCTAAMRKQPSSTAPSHPTPTCAAPLHVLIGHGHRCSRGLGLQDIVLLVELLLSLELHRTRVGGRVRGRVGGGEQLWRSRGGGHPLSTASMAGAGPQLSALSHQAQAHHPGTCI